MIHPLLPLEPPFEPDAADLLSGYPKQDGYLLKLFRLFANSPRFLRKGVANLLDRDSPLSLRERELVILRTCANKGCEYEWGVHVSIFARAAGFSREQVAATLCDSPERWFDYTRERSLLDIVDQLCARCTLDDDGFAALQTLWSQAEQLEILALCGNYHTISMVANASRITQEDFAARFEHYAEG